MKKQELADGIRFAGQRVVTMAQNTKDWDHQLGHQWTSRDAFAHVASTAPGAANLAPMLDGPMLSGLGVNQIAAMNASNISQMAGKSNEEITQAILDGMNTSASFVETMAEDDLDKLVNLGGYSWPKSEIIAQIWIHHQMAHAYEASARWPLL
ncbi:MAG: hypothetical protein ABI305_05590 [Tepidiformaceae bacterium]